MIITTLDQQNQCKMNEKELHEFEMAWEEMAQAGRRFLRLFNSPNKNILKEDRQSFNEAFQLISQAQETVSAIAENMDN